MGNKLRAMQFQHMLNERGLKIKTSDWDLVLIETGYAERINDWRGKFLQIDQDALAVLEGYFETVEKYRKLGLIPLRNSYRANGWDFVAYAKGANTPDQIITEWPELWKGPIGGDNRAVYGIPSAVNLLKYLGGFTSAMTMHREWLDVFTGSGYAKQIMYGKQKTWRFDVDALFGQPKYVELIAELKKDQPGGVLYKEKYDPNAEDFAAFMGGANTMRSAFEQWPGVRRAMGLKPYTNPTQDVG